MPCQIARQTSPLKGVRDFSAVTDTELCAVCYQLNVDIQIKKILPFYVLDQAARYEIQKGKIIRLMLLGEINNHAAGEFSLLHFIKNSINILERTHVHFGYDFSFCSETEGLFQVFTSAHQRADHLNTV